MVFEIFYEAIKLLWAMRPRTRRPLIVASVNYPQPDGDSGNPVPDEEAKLAYPVPSVDEAELIHPENSSNPVCTRMSQEDENPNVGEQPPVDLPPSVDTIEDFLPSESLPLLEVIVDNSRFLGAEFVLVSNLPPWLSQDQLIGHFDSAVGEVDIEKTLMIYDRNNVYTRSMVVSFVYAPDAIRAFQIHHGMLCEGYKLYAQYHINPQQKLIQDLNLVPGGLQFFAAQNCMGPDFPSEITRQTELTKIENEEFGFELDLEVVERFSNQSFPYDLPALDDQLESQVVLPKQDAAFQTELLRMHELLQKTIDENKELNARLEDYERRLLKLECELNDRNSVSSGVTLNKGTQTWISETTTETRTDDEALPQPPAYVDASVDSTPQAASDEVLPLPTVFEPVTPPTSPNNILDSLFEGISSRVPMAEQQVTAAPVCIAPPSEIIHQQPKDDSSMQFAYSDFRYKNREVQGYTIIPTSHDDAKAMENTSSLNLMKDLSPTIASSAPKIVQPRTNSFIIRNGVTRTRHEYMEELSDIGNEHYGRIVGKGGKKVGELSTRYGVEIAISKQEDLADRIKVTITSGNAADRCAAANEISEQLPVIVDVGFDFEFLTRQQQRRSYVSFPYVRINRAGKGGPPGYVFNGKLEECRMAFEELKLRR